MALAQCPRGLPLPWLLAHWRVPFLNEGFFQKKIFFLFLSGGYLGSLACLVLGLYCLPVGATLILAACFYHGCLPMDVVMALGTCIWACHGLGIVLIGATMALAACPLNDYFLK